MGDRQRRDRGEVGMGAAPHPPQRGQLLKGTRERKREGELGKKEKGKKRKEEEERGPEGRKPAGGRDKP